MVWANKNRISRLCTHIKIRVDMMIYRNFFQETRKSRSEVANHLPSCVGNCRMKNDFFGRLFPFPFSIYEDVLE